MTNPSHFRVSCDVCGIEVPKVHLSEHVLVMHNNYNCSKCDESFESKILLRRHTIEVHGSEKSYRSKKRHFCPLCSKDYDYRKQLDDHIRSFHDKERNAQCQICHKSKNFNQLRWLLSFDSLYSSILPPRFEEAHPSCARRQECRLRSLREKVYLRGEPEAPYEIPPATFLRMSLWRLR